MGQKKRSVSNFVATCFLERQQMKFAYMNGPSAAQSLNDSEYVFARGLCRIRLVTNYRTSTIGKECWDVRIYMYGSTQQSGMEGVPVIAACAHVLRKHAGVFVNRFKLPPNQPTPIACGAEIVVRAEVVVIGYSVASHCQL